MYDEAFLYIIECGPIDYPDHKFAVTSNKDVKKDLEEFNRLHEIWERQLAKYIIAFPEKAPVPPTCEPDEVVTFFKSKSYLDFYDANEAYMTRRRQYITEFNVPEPKSRRFLLDKGYGVQEIKVLSADA